MFCPMRMASSAKPIDLLCVEEECAWWFKDEDMDRGRCAMVCLPVFLEPLCGLEATLRKIHHKLESDTTGE